MWKEPLGLCSLEVALLLKVLPLGTVLGFAMKNQEESPTDLGRRRERVIIVKHTKCVLYNKDLISGERDLMEPSPSWREGTVSNPPLSSLPYSL